MLQIKSKSIGSGSLSSSFKLSRLGGLICHVEVELPGMAMQQTSSGVKSFKNEQACSGANFLNSSSISLVYFCACLCCDVILQIGYSKFANLQKIFFKVCKFLLLLSQNLYICTKNPDNSMSTLHDCGGKLLLKPSLNENNKSGNQMMRIMIARSTPPNPYFMNALRFWPRGVGYF